MNKLKQISIKFFNSWWKPILLLAVIGFVLYIPTINDSYHYLDDNALIKDNFYKIQNLSHIKHSFKEGVFPYSGNNETYYRPILTTSFVIDAQFSDGKNIKSFHITNIVLHIISAILIYLLLIKLKIKKELAWLLSLFFVIHPINEHAVAWIPGRNDPLLTVFFLAGFLFFLNYLKSKKVWQYILYIFFFILSLLTKETALAFPILILIYTYLIHKEKIFSKFSIINACVLVAITIGWLILHAAIIGNPLAAEYNIIHSMWLNSPAIFTYLGKILFVHNLSVFPVLPDLPIIYGIIVFCIISTLIYFSKKVDWKYIIFGTLWFLGTLAPSLIKTVANQAQIVEFAEHRVYLALFGLLIILSQINIPLNRRVYKNISIGLVILLLCIFTTKTITHAKVYTDEISFWHNAVEYSPSSAFNHNNLGAMYYLNKKYSLAEQEWLKASKINPKEKLVQNNLGLIYAGKGEYEKAYNAYNKELKINPLYPNTHFNLGLLLYNTDNIDKALEEWNKTISIDPYYFAAYEYLAAHYVNNDKLDKAKEYIDKMIELGGTPSPSLLEKLK
ncbi:MAG: tetratricopeptide repeat protein [Candidatus Komeilibacteria bacterium]